MKLHACMKLSWLLFKKILSTCQRKSTSRLPAEQGAQPGTGAQDHGIMT